MNVVLDFQVELSPEYRQTLYPLLPDGLTPLRLDPNQELQELPEQNAGIVFIITLPVDVLGYHRDFFRKFRHSPQWFFVLLNPSDHQFVKLKNVRIEYDLMNCAFFPAPAPEQFREAVRQIVSTVPRITGKTLLASKHRTSELNHLAEYLFDGQSERYEICRIQETTSTDAVYFLLCGERESDFRGVSVPDAMEPLFVALHPERNIQQYLRPEKLIRFLSEEYHMTTERVRKRLYFVSLQRESDTDAMLLWDKFGLPLPRSEYTADACDAFRRTISKGGERLKARISQQNSSEKKVTENAEN